MTKSLKIKKQRYVDVLDDMLKSCQKRCNDNATKVGNMDVDQVVNLVSDIIEGKENKNQIFELDFVKFGKDYAQSLRKARHVGNAKTYEVALNNLVRFTGREVVSIHEITSTFIKKWIQWIGDNPARPNRKKGGRSASLYPSNIWALHNLAKDEFNEEEMGLIRGCLDFSEYR